MGALGGVAGHGRGAFEFGAGFRVPAKPGEQVAADTRQQVIVLERGIAGQ